MNEKCAGNILLIDDEDIVRTLFAEMLENFGYNVHSFSDPVEAVDFYDKNHEDIDLVFIDMIMPELSGRETFFLLKKINRKIKAVLLSGFSMNSDIEKLLDEEGCIDFLKKPIKFNVLKKVLGKIFKCELPDLDELAEKIKKTLNIPQEEMKEALVNMGGNTQLFAKMISRFINDSSGSESRFAGYIEEEKFDDIMILSHSIKSSAASLGLMKLKEAAEFLEKMSLEKDIKKCSEAFILLKEEFAFVRNKVGELILLMENDSVSRENSTEKVEKETVLKHLRDLLKFAAQNRPAPVKDIFFVKLKGYSCKGFDFEKRDELKNEIVKYNFSELVPLIENIIKEVEHG